MRCSFEAWSHVGAAGHRWREGERPKRMQQQQQQCADGEQINPAFQSLADCKNVDFGFLASGSSEYRCVWDKIGIEALHETKGAVIDGYAQDRHVVSVHHAVHEPDGLPARHHPRRPHHHFGEECPVPFPGYFGHVVANDVVR